MNKFHQDQKCSIAQYISDEEVISRIEMHTLELLLHLTNGTNHEFSMISRSKNNQIETNDLIRLGTKEKKRKYNQKGITTYFQSKNRKFNL